MLFYFILAVYTCATKYSATTLQRKYVGGEMLICHGNRQFGLRNIWHNVYMFTCAWQFVANLKMSDVSDDSYLYAVAAASVVLTADITNVGWRKGTHGCDHCYVVGRRSARATCSCPNCKQWTHGYANFTRVSPAEFNFLLCAIREQITGSGRWRRPIPPPAHVTYWSRVQAGRCDWLQQFQLMNISVQAQKYANEPKIFYDGIFIYLLQCYRSDIRTSAIK